MIRLSREQRRVRQSISEIGLAVRHSTYRMTARWQSLSAQPEQAELRYSHSASPVAAAGHVGVVGELKVVEARGVVVAEMVVVITDEVVVRIAAEEEDCTRAPITVIDRAVIVVVVAVVVGHTAAIAAIVGRASGRREQRNGEDHCGRDFHRSASSFLSPST